MEFIGSEAKNPSNERGAKLERVDPSLRAG
jgi:hypothetical protein